MKGKKYHWDSQISYKNAGSSKEELFYASGDSTLTSDPKLIFEKRRDIITFKGIIYHKWHDVYDFHPGWKVYVPFFGIIQDSAMAKLRPSGTGPLMMKSSWRQTFEGEFWILIDSNTKISHIVKNEFKWGTIE